jgi:hypothetical protein
MQDNPDMRPAGHTSGSFRVAWTHVHSLNIFAGDAR